MGDSLALPRVGSIEDPIRLAVLISGGGSGLASLLKFQSEESRCHQTVLVLADSEGAGGLEHGRKSEIESKGIPLPTDLPAPDRRRAHEEIIERHLQSSNVELVVLSGYMRILTPSFVGKWKGRIVNVHPSLLPDFPGAHAHRDVLSAGVPITGCTVHLVDEGVDTGPILAQMEVPVMAGDDATSLQERVKQVEHALYPQVIDLLCTGQISL
ncbi:MAG: phosphoribosylglycinamide formyltransferase [Candidatus Thalassarchaeaceae archaeon]